MLVHHLPGYELSHSVVALLVVCHLALGVVLLVLALLDVPSLDEHSLPDVALLLRIRVKINTLLHDVSLSGR